MTYKNEMPDDINISRTSKDYWVVCLSCGVQFHGDHGCHPSRVEAPDAKKALEAIDNAFMTVTNGTTAPVTVTYLDDEKCFITETIRRALAAIEKWGGE